MELKKLTYDKRIECLLDCKRTMFASRYIKEHKKGALK